MLARAAAAEVLTGEQDRRALVARLVQHEIRVQRTLRVVHARFAMVEISPLVECIRAEAGALDRLQELLRDDRVRVDVLAIERCDGAGVYGEFVHDAYACSEPQTLARKRGLRAAMPAFKYSAG